LEIFSPSKWLELFKMDETSESQARLAAVYAAHKNCLLGYATINVSDNNDMGRGPVMDETLWNPRKATVHRTKALFDALDQGRATLPFTPKHAIVIAVERDMVDVTRLARQGDSNYRHVKWVGNVRDRSMLLCNGTSRVHMMRELLLGRQLEGYNRVRRQLERDYAKLRPVPEKLTELQKKVAEARDYLERKGDWLAMFLDRGEFERTPNWSLWDSLITGLFHPAGMIEGSPYSAELKLMIASNTTAGHQEDTADQTMAMVIQLMRTSPEEEHESLLQTAIQTSIHKNRTKLTALLNDRGIMDMLTTAAEVKGLFGEKDLTVSYLSSWAKVISGVSAIVLTLLASSLLFIYFVFFSAFFFCQTMVTYVLAGIQEIDWLVTPGKLMPTQEALKLEKAQLQEMRRSMRSKIWRGEGRRPRRDLLDAGFFSILVESYMEHLEPNHTGYGSHKGLDENAWARYDAAMKSYRASITEGLELWADGRREEHEGDEEAIAVLRNMKVRLSWLLTMSIFRHHAFSPKLSTPNPLLCNAFVKDLAAMMLVNQDWLVVVLDWLDPLFSHVLYELRKNKPFSHALHGLQYWLRVKHGLDVGTAQLSANSVSCPFIVCQFRTD
jgi:hypothetical protein